MSIDLIETLYWLSQASNRAFSTRTHCLECIMTVGYIIYKAYINPHGEGITRNVDSNIKQ